MPAPTLTDYQQSTWSDAVGTSEVTSTLTWADGAYIVILGASSDNALYQIDTPTAPGLTFLPVAGTPTNTNSNCKLYAWDATAVGAGSGVVTATVVGGAGGRGIAAFVFNGSGGLRNTAIATGLGGTTTQSLIRGSNNSAVLQVWGDWDAVNDVAVSWTPAEFTERVAQFVSGQATFFVASWTDQGAAGTTSYGFTAGGATATCALTLEIKGIPVIPSMLNFPKPKLRL